MPRPRRWTSPPTRREITLLLFSFTLFVLSRNIETSLRAVGVNPAKLNSGYLSKIGFGNRDPGLEQDGRRPVEWRDDLERLIAGDWEWKDGEIASVEHAQDSLVLKELGDGVEASTYIFKASAGKTASRSATREAVGIGLEKGVTLGEGFVRWGEKGEKVPETKVLAHIPGYTIFEDLFMLNGTFYLIADKASLVPPLVSIASSASDRSLPPTPKDWQIITREEATAVLGSYGGRIQGTTWLTTDPAESQDPYTLFSLYRMHSYLLSPKAATPFKSSSGLRIIGPGNSGTEYVAPPVRLIFPSVPTFSSPGLQPVDGNPKTHPPLRIKSYNGLHPHFLKAVFPAMGIEYTEDWKDFVDLHVPYLFERILVADSGAAGRGRGSWTVGWRPPMTKIDNGHELRRRDPTGQTANASDIVTEDGKRAEDDHADKPAWAAPFVGLDVSYDWWTPVRESLRSYLRLPPESDSSLSTTKQAKPQRKKPILTYVSLQMEPASVGPRLKSEDHAALLRGLRKLENDGVLGGVHVVRGNGSMDVWEDRVKGIVESSIVVGPYGPHLADSVFMKVPPPALEASSTEPSAAPEERQSTAPVLIELFPPGMFRRDQEYAVRSLGLRYIAWWNGRKFSGNSLPPVMGMPSDRLPHLGDVQITLDTDAVLQAIREEALRISQAA